MRKKTKYLVLILALLIVFFMSNSLAYVSFQGDKVFEFNSDADISIAFGKLENGTGTWGSETNPYLIENPQHLSNLEYLTNNGTLDSGDFYFSVTQNIDMTGISLNPIGNEEHPFKHTLEGDSRIISNLNIVATDGQVDIGVFGSIMNGASINDLILSGVNITSINNGNLINLANHNTAKDSPDTENCHIGIFCGHLDGQVNNISIYNSNVDINSSGLDYYSKYGSIGYCGSNARIGDQLVSAIQDSGGSGGHTGDMGYWYTDYFYDNIGRPLYKDSNDNVTFEAAGNTRYNNYYFLTGTSQTGSNSSFAQKSGNSINLSSNKSVHAEGVFSYHTSKSTDNIRLLPSPQSIVYYNNNPINLNQVYSDRTSNEYRLQRELYDPYSNSFITSFNSALLIADNTTGKDATIVDEYTGITPANATTEKITAGIYFDLTTTAKIIVVVRNPSNTAKTLSLKKTNDSWGGGRIDTVSTQALANNNQNLQLFEYEITPNAGDHFAIGGNNIEIVYLAVGGQEHGQSGGESHHNTQNYKPLPTVDFIYNTANPVGSTGYQHSFVVPYFTEGSASNKVSDLRVEFRRSFDGTNYSFNMNASGVAANNDDASENPLFDYVKGQDSLDAITTIRGNR